jgi:carboxylate-amine ligase
MRDGVDGVLVDLDDGATIATSERLLGLVEELLPTAAALGCDEELLGVGRLLLDGGAARQRRVVAEHGLGHLVPWLAAETVAHDEAAEAPPVLLESGA